MAIEDEQGTKGEGRTGGRGSKGDPTVVPKGEDSVRVLPLVAGLVLFAVLLFLPAPEGLSPEAWSVVAVAALMIVWWITEAVPVAVTALLPLALFPLLGAVGAGEAAAPYADPIIFLFMGGFMLAGAMQRWNLHRRIALNIVSRTGSRQHHIVAGFMVATGFVSMWVSNTATTVMMLPVALSVAGLLDEDEGGDGSFGRSLLLGVAYGASIGGVATLIGTPPNALLAGTLSQNYGYDLGFARWMLIGVPVALVMMVGAWLILTRFAIRLGRDEVPGASELIAGELKGLGGWSRQEKVVGVVFLVTATLWILRTFLTDLLPGLTDAGIAIGAAIVLFAIPSGRHKGEAMLDWSTASRLPWGVLVLFGGGLSLAGAVNETGLDEWIGAALGGTAALLPLIALVALVAFVVLLLTEFTSNTATGATFLPLVAALSLNLGENPLLLAVPTALAASMAFMMPVATPPNALVFSSGRISIPQMAGIGVWVNLLSLVVIVTIGYLVLLTLFGVSLGEVPDWAASAGAVEDALTAQ